ncbi:MAG: DUF1003 domain-containing protein [Candidatus Altiarchaeota archaeon]
MKNNNVCCLCHTEHPHSKLTVGEILRPKVFDFIHKQHPDFTHEKMICTVCLNDKRSEYILSLLGEDNRKISHLEHEVARSIKENEMLSANIMEEYDEKLTLGERLSDRIATFGGSWTFITIFALLISAWIIVNVYLIQKPVDPFPFILLNLMLSCLAAVQAPVLMMSQNRQEARDRMRSKHDYQINLKAELEIQHLNEKLDLLLKHQWQNLIQIQQIQTDILGEIRERR